MEDYDEPEETEGLCEDMDIVEVTYQCPGCGDEWQVVTEENGEILDVAPEEENCRHCGTKGMQI